MNPLEEFKPVPSWHADVSGNGVRSKFRDQPDRAATIARLTDYVEIVFFEYDLQARSEKCVIIHNQDFRFHKRF
jgi:hypothetical protein